ncbi:DUF788-domain-containing protein [Amylostereum chailletii]|nr:DUF788-domain-containing protein [Amylostereum chailletii]
MAKGAAKRTGTLTLLFLRAVSSFLSLASQNEAALQNLFYGQVLNNVVPLILRIIFRFRGYTMTKKVIVLYASSFGLSQFLYGRLVRMGTPRRDASGVVLSSGDDLNQPGVTEWMFDVLYIAWAAQSGSAIASEWFWWLYAAIPVFLLYKLWYSFISPMVLGRSSGSAEEEAPPESLSKRQEKLKKRSDRGDPRVKAQTRR